MLLEAGGKPLIVHTLERARSAEMIDRVIVAVDHEDLFKAVESAGGEAVMTSAAHVSGSDRIAEVAAGLEGEPIIVNVQGDEPLISPDVIDRAVLALEEDPLADIATVWEPFEKAEDVLSPDVVKVVIDDDGYALYFSRSPIPFPRDEVRKHGDLESALKSDTGNIESYKKHTGLYVFRRDSLIGFTSLEPTVLELSERLEQLRALENGFLIRVVEGDGGSLGIDTAEDFARFRALIEKEAPGI